MAGTGLPMSGFGFLEERFSSEENEALRPGASDLENIKPLTRGCSAERWRRWISSSAHHYMLLQGINDDAGEMLCAACGWGDPEKEDKVRQLLEKELSLKPESVITFFWSESHAVETQWGTFLKYWPVFCYGSDDSNIVVIHEVPKALVYVEDHLWVVDRKRYFEPSRT